jgi:hypothetical protein
MCVCNYVARSSASPEPRNEDALEARDTTPRGAFAQWQLGAISLGRRIAIRMAIRQTEKGPTSNP